MKKSILIGLAAPLLLSALPAIASVCPDLAGNYECGGKGILLSVSDAGTYFYFTLTGPMALDPNSFQGGSYTLSKVGKVTFAMEGSGYSSLDVASVCEGNSELKLDSDVNDPIAGPTHISKNIYKDSRGALRKSTLFTFSDGSTRKGDDEVCMPR